MNTQDEREEIRIHQLNAAIEEEYGHLALDEVDVLAEAYDRVVEDVFDVFKTGFRRFQFYPITQDERHYSVVVPESIAEYLRKRDPFWAVIGLKDGVADLLYMSPHYLCWPAIEKWSQGLHGT